MRLVLCGFWVWFSSKPVAPIFEFNNNCARSQLYVCRCLQLLSPRSKWINFMLSTWRYYAPGQWRPTPSATRPAQRHTWPRHACDPWWRPIGTGRNWWTSTRTWAPAKRVAAGCRRMTCCVLSRCLWLVIRVEWNCLVGDKVYIKYFEEKNHSSYSINTKHIWNVCVRGTGILLKKNNIYLIKSIMHYIIKGYYINYLLHYLLVFVQNKILY